MRHYRRHIIAAFGAVLLAGTAMSAHAAPVKKQVMPSFDRVEIQPNFAVPSTELNYFAQRKISASDAKSIALSRYPNGEVIDISRNGNTYRVRVDLKNGRIKDVYIDATTGRVKR